MNLIKKDAADTRVESKKGSEYRLPPVDILENDGEYMMFFDVPGVEKDDIQLKIEKGVLTLTAECSKLPGKDFECLRNEMSFTGFRRSFELGDSVNGDSIVADYKNGTLKLTLPKREEQKTKQIKIRIE